MGSKQSSNLQAAATPREASEPSRDDIGVPGRSKLYIAKCLASRLCIAMNEAEEIKGGKPPLTPEVVVIFHRKFTTVFNYGYLAAFI